MPWERASLLECGASLSDTDALWSHSFFGQNGLGWPGALCELAAGLPVPGWRCTVPPPSGVLD